jgi:signal transduction histidine kinase/DNA-binding response OmpR family regulator/HAMP domain-containing protein
VKSLSLRGRVLLLIALATTPAIALILYSTWEERTRATMEAERQTQQLAIVVAEEQRRIIDQTRQLLGVLSSLPSLRNQTLPSPECNELLARLRSQSPVYANIGIVDAQGVLLCSALPFKPPINFADRVWFRRTVATWEFSIGEYLVGRLTALPSLGVGQPLADANDQLKGVIYTTIDLAWLQRLSAKLPLPPGTVVVVVDTSGTVLMRHPDPDHQWMGQPAPETDMLKTALASGCKGFAEMRGQDGVVRLNAIQPLQMVSNACVYVRVGVPKDEVYGPVDRRLWRNLVAMALVTVLVFSTAWIGGDWLVLRRMRALMEAAQRLGRGDLSARTGLPHDPEELGQLAASFDDMAADIQARETYIVEADRALKRSYRGLAVLSAGNQVMLRTADEQTLLDAMCRTIVERGGYPVAWVGFTEANQRIRPVAGHGVELSQLDSRCLSWDAALSGDAAPGAAIRNRSAALFTITPDNKPLACMVDSGCRAALAFPLADDAGPFGVLTIYSPEVDAFEHGEVELLEEAAADLAFGIGRLRDQLRRREAEDANKIKSEFLANMSHELRTPLNAIIGFSDVLKDGLLGELSPRQKEYTTDIYHSGQHLLSLINDILDLSKVEAGKMALDLETVAVTALLESSLSVVREKAAAHAIVLDQKVQENLPAIQLDGRKTKQIIYNLLSNAIKFTPDGGRVTLAARRVARGEVEGWATAQPNSIRLPLPPGDFTEFLEISVEDTGIGIKREDAPRLFQPFSQLDSSLSRNYEGTGLGLVMVMKMTALQGGTVAVASEPERGSRFTFWLPWRPAEAAPGETPLPVKSAVDTTGTEKNLALIIEDNDFAADLERLQLEAEGLTVLRIGSAEAALDLLEHRHPAVIVLDIFLPGMDGWEFLSRIKRADSPWKDVPVVIASIAADAQKGFSLGAAQVLQKPVTREDLANALRRLGLDGNDCQDCRVLIVDDDPKSVELLAAYLAEPGYQALRAYGGREGIEMARRQRPDLILLDMMMPDVNGFDVIDALRADSSTVAIPVIIITAKELSADERAALSGCVSAVLEKASFDHGQLITEVRRALAHRNRATT